MNSELFLATINDKTAIELSTDAVAQLDTVQTEEGQFHVLHQGKSFNVTVVSVDKRGKQVQLRLNGKTHVVRIQDKYDLLVKEMGLSASVVHKVSVLRAPMPGLVLSILVEPGQSVVQGEPMLILEAMKMENVIKSPGMGTVKRVVVPKGKPVEKGEVLIEME